MENYLKLKGKSIKNMNKAQWFCLNKGINSMAEIYTIKSDKLKMRYWLDLNDQLHYVEF